MSKDFKEYSIEEVLNSRKERKTQNLRFNLLLSEVNKNNKYSSDALMKRIYECGTYLEFIATPDFDKRKLVNANFCCTRFCPHCAYNKSKKDAAELYVILEYLYKDYEFIFLTLTSPNVDGKNLEKELISYSKAYDKLRFEEAYKRVVKGYLRKLEVTYNSHSGTYHPHYHVLLAVDKDYFDKDLNGNYLDKYIFQKDWLKMWQKVKKDRSIKIVDVRRFDKEKKTSVLEITKYIAKDSDYLHSAKVFETFYTSLKNKRYYALGGVLKEAKIKYKNGELDYLKEKDKNQYLYKLLYRWCYSNMTYEQLEHMLLTPDELKKYNIDYIDEVDDFDFES